jgi:hypothetical protein
MLKTIKNLFQKFNIFKYINVPVFVISLAVGIFMVYVTMPNNRIIYVYPTPENVDILQYKDKSETCFQVKESEVTCPSNEKDIASIPVQS